MQQAKALPRRTKARWSQARLRGFRSRVPTTPQWRSRSWAKRRSRRTCRLTLHQIDVLNRDGAAVAEIDHQDSQSNGCLRGSHGKHEQSKYLPHKISQVAGEGDEIDVHGKQDQFYR